MLIEAVSLTVYSPLMDSLTIISIAPEERARINAILAVVVIALISPFGWIAGQLSEINRSLPFILNICLYDVAMGLLLVAWRWREQEGTNQPSVPESAALIE